MPSVCGNVPLSFFSNSYELLRIAVPISAHEIFDSVSVQQAMIQRFDMIRYICNLGQIKKLVG